MPGLSFPILALIASAILFAPLASWLALQRARSWALWFLFGVALGPVASLLLVLAPPGRCPACGTPSIGWPLSCSNCGMGFGMRAGSIGRKAAIGAPAADPATPAIEAAAPATRRAAPRPRRTAGAVKAPPGRTAIAASPPHLETAPDVEPARRSATTLGRRPSPEAAAPADAIAILGSGVFIGGSESLQVGSRYLLARVGADLQILGPVHISPSAVAARLPLADVEPTLLADRLLITSTQPGRGSHVAFGGVSLQHGVDVARDFRPSGLDPSSSA